MSELAQFREDAVEDTGGLAGVDALAVEPYIGGENCVIPPPSGALRPDRVSQRIADRRTQGRRLVSAPVCMALRPSRQTE
jgi:hypothetical protein